MNKKIYCNFLKCHNERQDFQVYPGKLGKIIYENISKKAWNIWILNQTKIINEKKLNLMKIKDRKLLEKEMINFLFKDKNILK